MKVKLDKRKKKKLAIRKKIFGLPERPRLTVYKSGKHLYAQLIDDVNHRTICSASTIEKIHSNKSMSLCNKSNTKEVGERIASRAKEKNISQIVFDKNGYRYHGVIQALADECRKNNLIF